MAFPRLTIGHDVSNKHRTLAAWSAVLLWAAVIFGFSSIPGSNVPGRFGSAAHFIEYAILGALILNALSRQTDWRLAVAKATVLASIYAITDELHQYFVPMRTPDPADWALDTLGALAGALLVASIANRRSAAQENSLDQ